MKYHSSGPQKGFTLIELLIVIAIIAVLAGAGFTAGIAAIQKAKRTKSLGVATAIEQAINNFYSDYGYLPAEGSGDSQLSDNEGTDAVFATCGAKAGDPSPASLNLLRELLGKDPVGYDPALNSRSTSYLSLGEGKGTGSGRKDGIIYDDTGVVEGIFDPWGGPYQISLDTNYNERLAVMPQASNSNVRILNSRRVAVWSDGADAASGATNERTQDDVKTW